MTNIFEEKNISKAVLKLGIPSMLGSLTVLIYNMADTYFVALTKEPAMIAGVTLCGPILLIIMSIAFVFGMGGSSVIARRLGEGNNKLAARCFNFSTYAMILAGIAVMVVGLCFMSQIANILGADSDNLGYTCDYLKWLLIGAPAIMVANGFVHSLRSIGFIKEATIGLALGNGINVLLDWVLIVLLQKGTMGAAMATSLGLLCSCIYYFMVLILQEKKGNECVQLSLKQFSLEKNMVRDVVKIGIPGALVTVLLSISNIILNNFIGIYGSNAVASYGIAFKIDTFPIMLSVGLSQGVAPLVGYCFGQKNEKNLSKSVIMGMVYGVILGSILTMIIFFGSNLFADIFLDEKDLIVQTTRFLRLMCFHAPLLGIINMVTAYFQALGKAVHSLFITILRNIVLFIPGVIIMNYLFKLDGVILTQLVEEVIMSVICIILYVQNKPQKMFL